MRSGAGIIHFPPGNQQFSNSEKFPGIGADSKGFYFLLFGVLQRKPSLLNKFITLLTHRNSFRTTISGQRQGNNGLTAPVICLLQIERILCPSSVRTSDTVSDIGEDTDGETSITAFSKVGDSTCLLHEINRLTVKTKIKVILKNCLIFLNYYKFINTSNSIKR